MQLRAYQSAALDQLRRRWREAPVYCAPTGSGKTCVLAEIARGAVAKGGRVLIIAHTRQIVKQTAARFAAYGLDVSCIMAGERPRPSAVYCASIQTLSRRGYPQASVVLIDEAHHCVSDTFAPLIKHYREAGAFISGATATPARLDGRGLGDVFGAIVQTVTIRSLIDQGFLVEPKVFAPPVDLSGIRTRAGDYALPELATRMAGLVGSLTKTWLERASGMRTIAFAVNVAHSRLIVEAFSALGVRAAHIDGETPTEERDAVLARLHDGDLTMVSSCMLISEGFDLPALQCAILARPTKSLVLFRQQVGRVMRPPGPVIVLDHAGNHHEHGPVTSEIEWSLKDKPKRPPGDVAEPVRTCPKCFAVLPPAVRVCPECGHEMAREEAEPPGVENPGVLVEFKAPERGTKDEEAAWYRTNVAEASITQRSLGWARYRFKDKWGVWPRGMKQIEVDNYECPGHVWEQKALGPRIVMRCKYCYDQRLPEPADAS